MINRLAEHLTVWRWWYPVLAIVALLAGSMVMVLGGEPGSDRSAYVVPLSFVAIAFLALAFIALAERRWPTRQDLGMRPGLSWRDVAVLAVVFVVTHLWFWAVSLGGDSDPDAARKLFVDSGFDAALPAAFATVLASVVLAPVCEELLYRGAVLRPIHDTIARRGSSTVAAVVAVAVSALLFAMPHLGEGATWQLVSSYVLTGVAFGVVYVVTGSMTAAMVSHSLQSMASFGQVLVFGRGDTEVSWVLWLLVFGAPLWVWLTARALHGVLPRGGSLSRARPGPAAGRAS